jgi:hypothetical protein
VAKQYVLSAPLYAKRQEVVSKIENFWPLVFEQSPPDVDRYITPNDANIFAKLKSLDVKRFEIPMGPEKIQGDAGDPRSIVIRFEFDENDYFTNSVLEKKFWYRRSNDGWSGLVSEPVKIDWKGEDPTAGLTDAAFAVFEERKKAGDMKKKGFAAHKKLLGLIENNNVDNTSFFAWFGYVSATRYVSAEESAQANKEYKERQDKRSQGEKVESPEPEEEDMADMSGDDEVHPEGDELAQLIAEDVWPNAIKYFSKHDFSTLAIILLTFVQLKHKRWKTCPRWTLKTCQMRTTTKTDQSTSEPWLARASPRPSPPATTPMSRPRRSRRNKSANMLFAQNDLL